MAVRKAEARDRDAVYSLARAFATSFAVEKAAFERSFAEILTHPEAYLIVAEVDAEVAGYLLGFVHQTFFANGPVGWVEEIMVGEEFRRQGIGRKLTEAFEAWALEQEVRQIALATRRAADFYEALRYEGSATYFRKRLWEKT